VRNNPELPRATGERPARLLAKQKALMAQVAGKFIKGRLADLAHLIEVLDGDKEIIGFETTKGEKEMLEATIRSRRRWWRSRSIARPCPRPGTNTGPSTASIGRRNRLLQYTIKNAARRRRRLTCASLPHC